MAQVSKTKSRNNVVEYYVSPKSLWLVNVKRYTKLRLHKTFAEVSVNHKLFKYLSNFRNDSFARFVSLLVIFAGRRDTVSNLCQRDLSLMTGMTLSTVKKYVKECRNRLFNTLPADHNGSVQAWLADKTVSIKFNSYMLLEWFFTGFEKERPVARNDKQIKFKFYYKDLRIKNYFIDIYNKDDREGGKQVGAYIMAENKIQNTEKQEVKSIIFQHFKNPIYTLGFDTINTPYPENWYNYKELHPIIKPYFKKGRWYSNIHNISKDEDRPKYLESIGLTRELDIHNALPYFMFALFPDTVSAKDKAAYLKVVRSWKLYEDAVDFLTIKARVPGKAFDEYVSTVVYKPKREEVKKGFQRYRNLSGKRKKQVEKIDSYYLNRFPTVREWLLQVKGKKGYMQNWLAWVETDFMSYLCEKLSSENIRFLWLHDAVFVSDENYDKAFEIRETLFDEFENTFM